MLPGATKSWSRVVSPSLARTSMTTGIHLRQWLFATGSAKPLPNTAVSGRNDRNHNTAPGAVAAGPVVRFDRPARRRDEVPAHREAKAGARAGRLRGEERIEHAVAIGGRNPRPIVSHADLSRDTAGRVFRADRDRPAGVRHRLRGVLHEVDEH